MGDTPRRESREELTLSDVSQGDPHLPPAGMPHHTNADLHAGLV